MKEIRKNIIKKSIWLMCISLLCASGCGRKSIETEAEAKAKTEITKTVNTQSVLERLGKEDAEDSEDAKSDWQVLTQKTSRGNYYIVINSANRIENSDQYIYRSRPLVIEVYDEEYTLLYSCTDEAAPGRTWELEDLNGDGYKDLICRAEKPEWRDMLYMWNEAYINDPGEPNVLPGHHLLDSMSYVVRENHITNIQGTNLFVTDFGNGLLKVYEWRSRTVAGDGFAEELGISDQAGFMPEVWTNRVATEDVDESGRKVEEYPALAGQMEAAGVFYSGYDVSDVRGLPYADEETVGRLLEIYQNVPFYGGDFTKGNVELYEEYLAVFMDMKEGKRTFFDMDSRWDIAFEDYEDFYGRKLSSEIDEKTGDVRGYELADVDGDGEPEFVIYNQYKDDLIMYTDYKEYLYVFDYDKDEDIIRMYDIFAGSYDKPFGTARVYEYSLTMHSHNSIIKVDDKFQTEWEFTVYVKPYSEEEMNFFIGIPAYEIEETNVSLTSKMKAQGYYTTYDRMFYFRVTEAQYEIFLSFLL